MALFECSRLRYHYRIHAALHQNVSGRSSILLAECVNSQLGTFHHMLCVAIRRGADGQIDTSKIDPVSPQKQGTAVDRQT